MDRKQTKVGYKNPPVNRRFKPGQSGNPAGRPKGRINTGTTWRKCLNELVEVTIRGRKQTMTVREALIRRLLQSSIAGEFKALQYALSQAGLHDADREETGTDPAEEAQRRELMEDILNSFRGKRHGSASG
jgi:hypothetical protein